MNRFIISALCLLCVTVSFSQTDTEPPYKKTKDFPAVNLLLPDSSHFTRNMLDKKKPVMVMLFNPQCEHCQHETEELVKNMEKLEGIQILMTTSMPFDSMKNFVGRYKLDQFKNIIVSQDPNFTLISFYSIHQLPSMAFYDRKKEFISLHEGGIAIDQILKELDK